MTLTFILDNVNKGSFTHEPDHNTTDFDFNVLLYSNTQLDDGPHQLHIVADGPTRVLTLFDYAVYTYVAVLPRNEATDIRSICKALTQSLHSHPRNHQILIRIKLRPKVQHHQTQLT